MIDLAENMLVEVKNLVKHFPITRGIIFKKEVARIRAVDGVSFEIERGKTLGLVGESGSGKSTTGRLLLRLLEPTGGTIKFDGSDITNLPEDDLKDLRRRTGIVFQDPYSSLDPRKRVVDIIAEPLVIARWGDRAKIVERAYELLELVGLRREDASKYPHQFSGGQRQRIAVARALALSPDLIVADEPVSALDVSVQAKIINLFANIQKELGVAYLFISHDLSVVRHISDKVAVMYLGKIVEYGPSDVIFEHPLHPYTKTLLTVVPVPNPRIMRSRRPTLLKGEIPSPINPPSGCRFHTRCPYVMRKCSEEEPQITQAKPNHFVSCLFWKEIEEGALTPQN
ncbi:MAG: dipeptide ABC transporter ATP-binding protein [Nitrososphaerales archaeon]